MEYSQHSAWCQKDTFVLEYLSICRCWFQRFTKCFHRPHVPLQTSSRGISTRPCNHPIFCADHVSHDGPKTFIVYVRPRHSMLQSCCSPAGVVCSRVQGRQPTKPPGFLH